MDVGVRVSKWVLFAWALLPLLTVNARAQLQESSSELDVEDDDCECIPFYQCNNKHGKDVIRLRLKTCDHLQDVCCPYIVEPTEAVPTPVVATPVVATPVVTNPVVKIPTMQNDCGIRSINDVGYKVLAGEDTLLGEFPWMVAILSMEGGEEKFKCGGSIIHPRVVLTAAHCVDTIDKANMVVRGGAYEFRRTEQIRPQQDRNVQTIIIHEDFDKDVALNDIALLILEEAFIYAENVNTICLPTEGNIIYEDCIVTGWGMNETDGVFQDGLRLVNVPIVPRGECQNLLRKTRLGKRFVLHKSFMCAGGVGADSCEGDGGGPLICPVKDGKANQYLQVGIVSWGIDCGVAPGVYVDVLVFVDWIEKQMNTVGFQPSY